MTKKTKTGYEEVLTVFLFFLQFWAGRGCAVLGFIHFSNLGFCQTVAVSPIGHMQNMMTSQLCLHPEVEFQVPDEKGLWSNLHFLFYRLK